jgi:hypothetical protein
MNSWLIAVELVVVGAAGLLEHAEGDAAGGAVAGHRGRLEELDDRADVPGRSSSSSMTW